jgi:aspartyl-tRNA(Asn)/glutamyl-tRNA(Gln) amidotransferase subunit A
MTGMSTENEICALSALEMLRAFADKTLSPVEVMQAHLRRTGRTNPDINALFSLRAESALEQARQSQSRWLRNEPCGRLDGVPVVLKDSVKCIGFDYYHGSAGYPGTPAEADGLPAARIKEAGGIILAKTTMPDFGMLAAGVSSQFGIVRNPWNLEANPGGSSAGSGAAVAAGMAPLAVGTDIAGSVRLPAAHNGLAGLKPSRGRIPHLQPSPVRATGPLARSSSDAGLLMSVLIRPDGRDYESLPATDEAPFCQLRDTPENFLRGRRIGLMLDMGYGRALDGRVKDAVTKAAGLFEQAGAIVELVPTVVEEDPMPFLNLFLQSRAHFELMSLPATRRDLVLPHLIEWSRRVEQATAPDLSRALFGLEDFKARVTAVLAPYDFVISPALSDVQFPAGAFGVDNEDHFAHCNFAIPFNQTGAPAHVVCCGFIDAMPVGLQIAGRRYDDLGVMRAGAVFERLAELEMPWPGDKAALGVSQVTSVIPGAI